jgi:hypothetical protein
MIGPRSWASRVAGRLSVTTALRSAMGFGGGSQCRRTNHARDDDAQQEAFHDLFSRLVEQGLLQPSPTGTAAEVKT